MSAFRICNAIEDNIYGLKDLISYLISQTDTTNREHGFSVCERDKDGVIKVTDYTIGGAHEILPKDAEKMTCLEGYSVLCSFHTHPGRISPYSNPVVSSGDIMYAIWEQSELMCIGMTAAHEKFGLSKIVACYGYPFYIDMGLISDNYNLYKKYNELQEKYINLPDRGRYVGEVSRVFEEYLRNYNLLKDKSKEIADEYAHLMYDPDCVIRM